MNELGGGAEAPRQPAAPATQAEQQVALARYAKAADVEALMTRIRKLEETMSKVLVKVRV